MKKITKVVLAAALVLLVLGAFTGAAAAAGPAAGAAHALPVEIHIQGDVVQGAEIHAASGLEGASAPNSAVVVKKTVKKGPGIPLIPFAPKPLPVTPMPVIKPVHHMESQVITL